MNQIWQCISADFKQRTRQQSFMVTLLTMGILTLLFFPAPDAHYQTLISNGYRGIYNSAWIGLCLGLLNVLFLPLICFYLVKNAIELDRKSKTCELIAATPISKQAFLFSKWCVNVLILILIVLMMLFSSIAIQLYYGESYQIDLWALAWPQLIIVFPLLLAISSVAIMFESINKLRGGLGNLVYFFLWLGFLVQTLESISGVGELMKQLDKDVLQRFPSQSGASNVGIIVRDETAEIKTFVWNGIEPTMTHILGSIPLLVFSIVCLLLAFVFFDRFSQGSSPESTKSTRVGLVFLTKSGNFLDSIFTSFTKYFSFTRLMRLELKLLLKGRSVYWFLGLIVLNIIQIFIEQQLLISVFLPISWLWCVLVISQLGQLEKQTNTQEIMTYSKQSSTSQSLASYSAAWILLALASIGSVFRFIVIAEWFLVVQLFVAISFTVSLAYFCGAVTGTKRMFEVLYPTLWYIGPIQAALYIDFFGVNSQASWQANMPYYFMAITIGLLCLTVSVRNKR